MAFCFFSSHLIPFHPIFLPPPFIPPFSPPPQTSLPSIPSPPPQTQTILLLSSPLLIPLITSTLHRRESPAHPGNSSTSPFPPPKKRKKKNEKNKGKKMEQKRRKRRMEMVELSITLSTYLFPLVGKSDRSRIPGSGPLIRWVYGRCMVDLW